ncbi:hypothetical protein UFOVP219_35 [uncultured Caudovirales phage]|uniref:Uncharacterized protein n=1 Tax=uncultured Caudovirales phage TaxID=2100421 RepID=A0A6J7WPE9_9CAUD|nr:hypothetical protein UFOVP219_35 [uncultured Caudovirales phage]
MSVIIKLLSKFDDSGIKKAQHGFGGLKKTLGAIGIGLGLKEVADGLMEAAKAASADQKSTQLLNNQLVKNAHATKAQVKQNDKFIESLSLQSGILDDNLRPAMAKLARGTGSVAQAQKLMKIALDASVVSGKPLDTVAQALSKAYNGNTSALARMFPELKKSKDAIGDLAKETAGAAAQQADPFMKFNNSMDILKEKLGNAILPMISDFVDYLSKPGGVVDQVGKFLDDLSNPKTDAGKTFIDIKNAVAETIDGVKNFFALFGGGDAMKGFANVATSLIKMLPALLALKGIMMLSSAGSAITNLAKAVALIRGTSTVPGATPVTDAVNSPIGTAVKGLALTQVATQFAADINEKNINSKLKPKGLSAAVTASTFTGTMAIPTANGSDFLGIGNNSTTVNVHVHSADPKAVVDAVSAYVKVNGKVPASWGTGGRR